MSSVSCTFRRMMVGVAMIVLTVAPSHSFAQDKPDCEKSFKIGQWEATGSAGWEIDGWNVTQDSPDDDDFQVTVWDDLVSLYVSGRLRRDDDGRNFFDEKPVVRIAISVDGDTVATGAADFKYFTGTDYGVIVKAFRAGRSAILTFVVEGGTTVQAEFSLSGFSQAADIASQLLDDMVQMRAAHKCNPPTLE